MKTSEQLEREGEVARARLNETLDELRARVTPGRVLDEVVDYARASDGGVMVSNLRRQIVANPLPLLLVGTGLAWLMMAGERSARTVRMDVNTSSVRDAAARATGAARALADTTASTVSDAAEGARSAALAARERMRSVASSSADAASSLIDSVRARAGSTYDRAARATQQAAATIGDSAAAVASRGGDFVDFCKDEPLLLAGLGLAFGAAIGVTLPRTETENRLVGEASDDVKEGMKRVAEKAKQSAKATYAQGTESKHAGSESKHPANESGPTTPGEEAAGAPSSGDACSVPPVGQDGKLR